MIKTILAVVGALFVLLIVLGGAVGAGAGFQAAHECAKYGTQTTEFQSCMDLKVADWQSH